MHLEAVGMRAASCVQNVRKLCSSGNIKITKTEHTVLVAMENSSECMVTAMAELFLHVYWTSSSGTCSLLRYLACFITGGLSRKARVTSEITNADFRANGY